jgi:hypothetical protein
MKFLVTQIKNEKSRIIEWVQYHLNIGFDKIIFFLDEPNDGSDLIVRKLSQENNNILWFPTDGIGYKIQTYVSPEEYGHSDSIHKRILRSYTTGLNYIKTNFGLDVNNWVSFLDIDEYIVETGDDNFSNFIDELPIDIDRIYFASYDMKCPINLNESVIEQSLYRWSDFTRNTARIKNCDGFFKGRTKVMSRVYNLEKVENVHNLDFKMGITVGGDLIESSYDYFIKKFHDKEYFKLFHYRNDSLLQIYDEYDNSALKTKEKYK